MKQRKATVRHEFEEHSQAQWRGLTERVKKPHRALQKGLEWSGVGMGGRGRMGGCARQDLGTSCS